jgi:hypothetical protein
MTALGAGLPLPWRSANAQDCPIVLKNSPTPLLAAIFEATWPARQLFIALLNNSTNQSFAVYRSPDFFNNIAPKPSFAALGLNGLKGWFAD